MEKYSHPTLKVVEFELRGGYLQIVSDDIGRGGRGRADDISILED